MQKAETATLKEPEKKLELTKLAEVSVDKDNKIYVNWPSDKKDIVLVGLAEAIKLVATYKPSGIVAPKPSFMDFVRGTKT